MGKRLEQLREDLWRNRATDVMHAEHESILANLRRDVHRLILSAMSQSIGKQV
ncbi:hypothetical protein D3C73_1656780 [compost metagenome]